VNFSTREFVRGSVSVRSLAPKAFDQSRLLKMWRRVLNAEGGPARYFDRILRSGRPLGDAPNVLSLALVVRWGSTRVLLGGDVMNGSKSPLSGWKGVLRLLQEYGETALITDLAVVKVAHHGSKHSFEPAVWRLHAQGVRPVALVAPFASSGLPDAPTLGALAVQASDLLVSAGSSELVQRATGAGWHGATSRASVLAGTTAPCVVVEMDAEGRTTVHATTSACAFGSSPRA
jgi:hypothetical protein